MSHRTSKERTSKRSRGGSGSQYPTVWSGWEWNAQYNCEVRYRLRAPNDYEYEYGPQSAATPRDTSNIVDTIPEQQYAPQLQAPNYTTAAVDTLTRDFASTSLRPSNRQIQQPRVQLHASQASTRIQANISTRNPDTSFEKFDPRYEVHKGHEFQWGKVFKVLWAEPAGNNASNAGESEYSVRSGKHGEQFHEKVRRFVIINCRDGHCICLPIMTYGGQGTNKYGVHAKDHAIIWTEKPVRFPGEYDKGLTKDPIRVDPFSKRHKLDEASRLNYAKLYTVEYNVKVWFIGKIHKDSEYHLTTDYNVVHPLLPRRGAPPPSSEDTYAYASGAADVYQAPAASYTNSNAAYPPTSSTSAYQSHLPTAPYTPYAGDEYSNVQIAPSYQTTRYPSSHTPLDQVDEDDSGPPSAYDKEDYYDDK